MSDAHSGPKAAPQPQAFAPLARGGGGAAGAPSRAGGYIVPRDQGPAAGLWQGPRVASNCLTVWEVWVVGVAREARAPRQQPRFPTLYKCGMPSVCCLMCTHSSLKERSFRNEGLERVAGCYNKRL
jgi:hypothetical protein